MKPVKDKPAANSFGVNDVLFILFKHKWKIMVLTVLSLIPAAVMYRNHIKNPKYESKAQLMVRYVIDRATDDPEAAGRTNDGGMTTQVAILRSHDTAKEAAINFGLDKLVPDAVSTPTVSEAAGKITAGLSVEAQVVRRGPSPNLLNVSYSNEDPDLAVGVLKQVIKTYFTRHLDLHRSGEAFERVQKQTDQARSALRQTEEEINRLKEQFGVLTIEGTMNEFEERRRVVRQSMLETEGLLAEQRAKVAALEKSFKAADMRSLDPLEQDNSPSSEDLSLEDRETQRKRALAVDEYRSLGQRLEILQLRRNEMLVEKKKGNSMVRSLDQQIKDVRTRGLDLVDEYPELAGVVAGGQQVPVSSLEDEKALANSLQAKLSSIEKQADGLVAEVSKISAMGFQLTGLERRRQMEEENYLRLSKGLEKAKLDEQLDPSKIPNISIIQEPSPPRKFLDEDAVKLIAGVAASGLILGLGIAFLLEMVVDRRVSRPVEIETRLQIPLLMTIPRIRSKDGIAKLIGREPGLELLGDAGDIVLPPVPNGSSLVAEPDTEHFIVPYASAIRDRVVFNFELNNINHKPKLVAVAGLTAGAGSSTVAAGLAKSFAENGDRKVLLVDLNPSTSGARISGKPVDSLVKALQVSRGEAFHKSSRSLYFASAPTRRDAGASNALAPTKLNELMPYLSASDFDYIIFDMPTVDPMSPTLTMAGFMDKVLLVLDAERTTKESLQWGYSELGKGRADVSCIYNKARSHAPRWVEGAA